VSLHHPICLGKLDPSLETALIVAVALLGIFGTYPDSYERMFVTLRNAAPGPVVDLIEHALDDAISSRGGAKGLLGIGLVISLYSASGATGSAVRSIEAAYGLDKDAAWWHAYVIRLLLTLVLSAMFLIAFAAILLAGSFFDWISQHFGISESVNDIVSAVRWPIGLTALLVANLLLLWSGSGRAKRIRHLLPGALASLALTLLATLGFDFYVDHFDSYGATYGSLGAVIVLLVWMWLISLGLIAGAALNAELDQHRETRRRPGAGLERGGSG
jgi:membrane protein